MIHKKTLDTFFFFKYISRKKVLYVWKLLLLDGYTTLHFKITFKEMYETNLSTNMQWHIFNCAVIIIMSTSAFITGLEPLTVAASLLLKTCNYYLYMYTHLNYIDSDNNGDNQ